MADRPTGGCLWGPSHCMDDLCRNSHIGLCGMTDDDFIDYEDEDWTPDDVVDGHAVDRLRGALDS